MKAGKETEMYNQGYMNGYNDGANARIEPDYWERLKHKYAGMAMQGVLSNPEVDLDYKSDECMPQAVAATAYNLAHALVEMMKEKRK